MTHEPQQSGVKINHSSALHAKVQTAESPFKSILFVSLHPLLLGLLLLLLLLGLKCRLSHEFWAVFIHQAKQGGSAERKELLTHEVDI